MWRYILFLMRYFILRDTAFLWISFEVKLFSFCFEYLGFCCIIQRKPYKRTHFSIPHAHTRKEKRLTCVHRKSFLIYYTAIVTENYIHIFNWTMWSNRLAPHILLYCISIETSLPLVSIYYVETIKANIDLKNINKDGLENSNLSMRRGFKEERNLSPKSRITQYDVSEWTCVVKVMKRHITQDQFASCNKTWSILRGLYIKEEASN